jgi:3-phenylpropionate/cinnamic acid dioxygenase small subunit
VGRPDVVDEEPIRALICAYAERLDAGDFDGVAALFDHGVFTSAQRSTPLEGRDAVRSLYTSVVVYGDGTPRTKHVLGNIEIDCDSGNGTATARCTFTVLQAVDGGLLRAVLAGRYHDRFARVDGEWCFAERLVLPDLVGELSEHMRHGRR